MKIHKHLIAVIAMAGTMGFSAVASAMDFTVYGSLRGGLQQSDTDDSTATVIGTGGENAQAFADVVEANGVASAATGTALTGVVEATAGSVEALANVAAANAVLGALYSGGTGTANAIGVSSIDLSGTTGEVTTVSDDAQLELGHGQFGSRIGIRGSEDLGNGAEAGLHWETKVGAAGGLQNGDGRHANVWYSGAFGKVTIGQQGNPYRNAANWDQSWWLGGQNRPNRNFGGDGGSRQQGVRYDGGSGAFNFSVMATANNDSSNAGAEQTVNIFANAAGTAKCATGALSGEDEGTAAVACQASETVTYDEVESETGVDSLIATGHYDMGVATINLGYRTDNNEAQAVGQAFDNFVISANGSLDALDWYVAFETNTDNTNVKRSSAAVITHATTLSDEAKAANAKVEDAANALATAHDSTTIGLFLGYNLSDVSKIYLEWEDTANDGLDLAGENLDRNSTLLGFSRKIGPNTAFIAEYVAVDNGSEADADSSTLQGYLKVDF